MLDDAAGNWSTPAQQQPGSANAAPSHQTTGATDTHGPGQQQVGGCCAVTNWVGSCPCTVDLSDTGTAALGLHHSVQRVLLLNLHISVVAQAAHAGSDSKDEAAVCDLTRPEYSTGQLLGHSK